MKGILDFILVLICVESAILELGADSSTTNKRPSAMAEPTSETIYNKEIIRSWFDTRDFSSSSVFPTTTTSTTSVSTMTSIESAPMTTSHSVDKKKESDPPFMKMTTNTSLITSGGQTVYLHCQVENLGDRQVSWIRRSDLKILTIGLILYTKDNRFCPLHEPNSNVWILKLTQAQVEDSGDYECQVSYHDDVEKKLKMPFSLTVLDSRAYIHDSPDLYVQRGSKLLLTCYVRESSSSPDYVYWYQNRLVLNYSPLVTIEDLMRSEKSDESGLSNSDFPSASDILVSRLSIVGLTRNHSGNYTCAPSNARPTSIMVHVVDDESGPAAMQHGTGSPRVSKSPLATLIIAILLCLSLTNVLTESTPVDRKKAVNRTTFSISTFSTSDKKLNSVDVTIDR